MNILSPRFLVKTAAMTAITLGLSAPLTISQAGAEEITLKMWSRADRSGPLRPGNIINASDTLNKAFAAAGSNTRVKVEVHENNAKGFDADALDLMKAFAAGKAPDLYIAAHEWIGAFAEAGYAKDLEDHIAGNPQYYGDIIPVLWNSVKYKGKRFGVPQDSEVRMFFYNKDHLRKIGKSDAFIEGLPAKVVSGDFNAYQLSDLAAEVVKKGGAKYGFIHRPNVGPDFLMIMASFGIEPSDAKTGKLKMSKKGITEFFKWLKYSVDIGALPKNMTSWSWDSVHAAFRGEESFMKFHGIWNVPKQLEVMKLKGKEDYFKKLGWLHAPSGKTGGRPSNLSHPIVYVVNPGSKHADLAAILVAMASQHVPNTNHAITTGHTPINFGQAAMPDFESKGWALQAGTSMLPYATFMPNHPKIGQYNSVVYKGIQGVETGRISPEDGAIFVIEELESELGNDVMITD